MQVVLAIVEFHPGSTRFVAESEIQRKGGSNTPIVLTVSAKPPGHLVPRSASADSLTRCPRIAAVEGVESKTPHLEAGVKYMLATSNDQSVVELDHAIGEILVDDAIADVGQ